MSRISESNNLDCPEIQRAELSLSGFIDPAHASRMAANLAQRAERERVMSEWEQVTAE